MLRIPATKEVALLLTGVVLLVFAFSPLPHRLGAYLGHSTAERDNKEWRRLIYLGEVAREDGDLTRAETHFRDACDSVRSRSEHPTAALEESVFLLGMTYMEQGALDVARPLLEEALEFASKLSEEPSFGASRALSQLAELHHALGEHETELRYARENLAVREAIQQRERVSELKALRALGRALRENDLSNEATGVYERVLSGQRAIVAGARRDMGVVLSDAAFAAYEAGDMERAYRLFDEAISFLEEAESKGDGLLTDVRREFARLQREMRQSP